MTIVPFYEIPPPCQIDYRQIMEAGAGLNDDKLIGWLKEELVHTAFDTFGAGRQSAGHQDLCRDAKPKAAEKLATGLLCGAADTWKGRRRRDELI